MQRREFLSSTLGMVVAVETLKDLQRFGESLPSAETMPMVFVGHGSPMNAVEENEFSAGWRTLGKELPKPQAILSISAHWETRGTFVTARYDQNANRSASWSTVQMRLKTRLLASVST